MPRKRDNIDREERKEETLRPSPYIGYNRDKLAIYLLSRKAYKIAESQFMRAIWLNPYEAVFKQHLAACLYQDGRYTEAKEWILKALEQKPDDTESKKILNLIEEKLTKK